MREAHTILPISRKSKNTDLDFISLPNDETINSE